MTPLIHVAGYISSESFQQHPTIIGWVTHWFDKARDAEAKGNKLVVIEVPVNDLSYALWEGAGALSGDWIGALPELIMPIDDIHE